MDSYSIYRMDKHPIYLDIPKVGFSVKVTKGQIIMETLNQFVQENVDRVFLNSIGEALDITKGAVYHYFASKDELFKETVLDTVNLLEEISMGQIDTTLPLKEQLGPLFNLKIMSEMYAQIIGLYLFKDHSVLITLLFTAIKKLDEAKDRVSQLYANTVTFFTEILKEGQERGEIQEDGDPAALVFQLSALIEGWLLISAVTDTDKQISHKAF